MQSSTVAAFGMLMVFEIAPEMKGCAAAIIRMWLSADNARVPVRPHGLAQSNTGRCSGFRCGAPSRVIAPQHQVLAASISARLKPSAASRSKPGIVERGRRDAEPLDAESFAQGPFVEGEFDVEGGGERGLGGGQRAVVEPLRAQALDG